MIRPESSTDDLIYVKEYINVSYIFHLTMNPENICGQGITACPRVYFFFF